MFSFDPALSTNRDKVRLYIGDTTASNAQLQDETIDGMLLVYSNPLSCAAALADNLAAKFASSVTFGVEGLTIRNSDKFEHYQALGTRLRLQATLAPGALGASVFGTSKSEEQSLDQDTDLVQPKFEIGMQDYPGASPTVHGSDDDESLLGI